MQASCPPRVRLHTDGSAVVSFADGSEVLWPADQVQHIAWQKFYACARNSKAHDKAQCARCLVRCAVREDKAVSVAVV